MRRGAFPGQAANDLGEATYIYLYQAFIEASSMQVSLDVVPRLSIFCLHLGLQVDMHEHARTQQVADRHEIIAMFWFDTVDASAQPRLKGNVLVGEKKERI